MIDLSSWRKRWNDAALRGIAALPVESPSRRWPMLGMLALGLVAGAVIGGYAVSHRSQMKRLAGYAHRTGDEPAEMDRGEAVERVAVVTTHRSNHRRKAATEV